mmetsp:Transcript_34894/g.88137  ORF Transcript_34894/g.88137 Transcript_34894/m.88137 type:complete len:211 (+) Transcript_34894:385-1017(+)
MEKSKRPLRGVRATSAFPLVTAPTTNPFCLSSCRVSTAPSNRSTLFLSLMNTSMVLDATCSGGYPALSATLSIVFLRRIVRFAPSSGDRVSLSASISALKLSASVSTLGYISLMCSMCAACARFSGGMQSHSVSSRSNVTARTLEVPTAARPAEAAAMEERWRWLGEVRGWQLTGREWWRGERRMGRMRIRAGVGSRINPPNNTLPPRTP